MPKTPTSVCNFTIQGDLCTYDTCCLKQGNLTYLPSVGGNAVYLTAFILLIIAQLYLGFRYKTHGFMWPFVLGCAGEAIGYGGRVWMAYNIFNFNAFLINLVPLTMAPALLTASIYICLSRLVTLYDPTISVSRLKPRTYSWIFISADLLSLILQSGGGAIAAMANDEKTSNIGVDVMIAGLAWQVISMFFFMVLCGDFAWRLKVSGVYRPIHAGTHARAADLKGTKRLFGFLIALTLATVFIFIRCVYRLAELQGGFDGKLANDQVTFMLFEGPLIIGAALALTIWHPGVCLGNFWMTGKWSKVKDQGTGLEELKVPVGASHQRLPSQERLISEPYRSNDFPPYRSEA